MTEYKITIEKNEYWYGLSVNDGVHFPLGRESEFHGDYRVNATENQLNPILLSNRGRYIWCEKGFRIDVSGGRMHLQSIDAPFIQTDAGSTLRDAYLAASARFFPTDGKVPPKEFFAVPQFNTWIELKYNQNQNDILRYAQEILKNGYPAGVLMIDDGWNEYYGGWRFHPGRFQNPKAMVEELHQMGFSVMLWTCPFISPDSAEFRELWDAQCLVKNEDGSAAVREWWNGYSAILDMSNQKASAWYTARNEYLRQEYGIDGFKFDAGDGKFYKDSDQTENHVDANEQNEQWALYGEGYCFNEFRSCFKAAGKPLVQRLADRKHSWDQDGVGALIPNELAQGIMGYAYTCPDMIGGGQIGSFLSDSFQMEEELFLRYAQCAALMPMMQFSTAPWRVLSPEHNQICQNLVQLHQRFADKIWMLALESAKSGEPIVRYMEYQFPGEGFETQKDQFMLGENILVAPVCEKGNFLKKVKLPKGSWQDEQGIIYEGNREIEVKADISRLPYFVRIYLS